MTRTYTAADFANAQFAEHGEENDPAFRRPDAGKLPWRCACGGAWSDEDMADMDWVPVTPARTIHDRDVEALCTDKASYERDDYLDGFIRGFQQAGGTILDDPEPTNTERLESIVRVAQEGWAGDVLRGEDAIKAWAKHLNDHGVTAPNVKGN